jgi:hypothetical protein
MFLYGRVLNPVLVYSILGKKGDEYIVPLAYKDTIVALAKFDIEDSLVLTNMMYCSTPGRFFPRWTKWPPVDSAEAYRIMRDSLPVDEKIIDQRLFDVTYSSVPYWGFLIEKATKDSTQKKIYWIDPILKKPE